MLYMLAWHTRVFKLRQLIAECIALCGYKGYFGMKISLARFRGEDFICGHCTTKVNVL